MALALGLCVLAGLIVLSIPVAARHVSAPIAFIVGVALVIPLLIRTQRAWVKFLWARRIEAARRHAEGVTDDPEPHVELGVLCSLAGANDAARAAFERARSIRPRHPQAIVGLAHLSADDGDLDRALELFTEASESDPELFAAHYGIGGVQRRREQYARAVLSYERALALEPDDAFTLLELSRCHLLLGDPDKAEDYHARAAGLGVRDVELERMIRASSSEG